MEMVTSALINAQHLASAAEARLLIAISFHFVKARLVYLDKVLQTLAAFPVRRRDIVVFTNTTDNAEQESLRQVFRNAGLVDGRDARLSVETALAHPFNLTWAHKRLISGAFLAPDSPYSHFAYLEDDEQLTLENFAYFLAAREILRPFDNLVPAFLRTEWSDKRGCSVNTDNTAPIMLGQRPFISHGDYAFVAADNPYCGGFILDQELGREYVNSRSFDLKRSRTVNREVHNFGVRERAAMGLTFENPPVPFIYRVVVPVAMSSRLAPHCALLAHLPNNYADHPIYPHGKIAMTDLFAGNFKAENEVALSSFNSTKQKRVRSNHRVRSGFQAMWRGIIINIIDSLRRVKRMIWGPATPKRDS
jgi:hypothetical protein